MQFELVDPARADVQQQALELVRGFVERLGIGGKSLRGFREQFIADAHNQRECALAGHEEMFHRSRPYGVRKAESFKRGV